MYIFVLYWHLPYHYYIILKIEIDHHNFREGISAGCFSPSCTSAPIYRYIKDNISNKMGHHLGHSRDHCQVFQHHRRYHQIVHPDLEAERGNDIMVIIFKLDMTITDMTITEEKKDISPYVHQYPHLFHIFKLDMTITEEKKDISPYVHQYSHLFQSPISAINFDIVNYINIVAINFDIVNYINNVDHIHQSQRSSHCLHPAGHECHPPLLCSSTSETSSLPYRAT